MSVDKWDHRQLCSDGSCIGVIGPDGTCKMCGRAAPNWGDERKRGLIDTPDDADDADDADGDSRDDDAPAVERPVRRAAVAGGGGEWNHRQLCSDGACIGVLGSDGTCKLCGKQGDATAHADEDDEHEDDDAADPTSAEDGAESDDAEGDEDEVDAADPTSAEGEDEDDDEGDEGDEGDEDDDEGDDEGGDDEGDEDDDEDDDEGDDDEGDDEGDEDDSKGVAAAVDDRRLCPDGACVGVIGPDGKCKICRKEAE